MSEPTEQLSPAELVQRSREAYGLTWKEMGAAMNRSPRMMQKIARGETSGESYRDALTELHETGAVSKAPRRRRNAAGKAPSPRRRETGAGSYSSRGARYQRTAPAALSESDIE